MRNRKISLEMILPILHVLLSFLYERALFHFTLDRDVVAAVPLQQGFGDTAERVMGYVLTKAFAILFICLFWKLIFYVKKHLKADRDLKIFAGIFLVGALVLGLLWPNIFTYSEDNLITYSYAIRFFPEYWHSAYSSVIYGACMMVLPHPFAICLLQWLFSLFTLGYLFTRIKESPVLQGKGKWLVFTLLLVPDSYYLLTNAYRTEQYALACLFFASLAVMDLVDGKLRSTKEILGIALLCGFLGVWRTEGVVLGVLGFACLLLFGYKQGVQKTVWYLLAVIVAFLVISVPQKLGDGKYYGKDYSFINSFPTLQNVLNADSANLSYEGAAEDLKALERVTPLPVIQCFGMDGYRRVNVQRGYIDINQSGVSKEVGAAYMKAYYRIILHNLPIYAKTQIFMVCQAGKLVEYPYVEKSKVWVDDVPQWTYDAWNIGREDLDSVPGVKAWKKLGLRNTVADVILAARNKVAQLLKKTYLQTATLGLAVLLAVCIFFREFYFLCRKKKSVPGPAALIFVLLGQAAAIALVMPAGVLAYFHAVVYCIWAVDLTYILCTFATKKQK
ncbi:MAG: hypothetical protein MJ114_00070 [Acetatifactor sp.]|nr:hypothetical protein [Acetatifactor sp.]